MALDIETFSSKTGPTCLFKAIGHPAAVDAAQALIAELAAAGPVAVFDPWDQLSTLAALYDLSGIAVDGVYVQDVLQVGRTVLGQAARPVSALGESGAGTLFVAAFDAGRLIDQMRALIGAERRVVTLDAMRIPDRLLTNPRNYLAPINFATNFAFFRDQDGHHTRLVSANYWGGYGARDVRIWARLFDGDGRVLGDFDQPLGGPNTGFVIDSREVRARLGVGDFTGQLFVHVVGAAGHDIVKYAVDTFASGPGGDAVLSCTHDANAWPSDYFAGLPAPADGETVVLWVQNSHPAPIPAGSLRLNRMGRDDDVALPEAVPGFATHRLDVARLLPDLAWPEQIEVTAGKHVVRPRYEIDTAAGRRRIAHVNVERTGLPPDPKLAELANLLGKGFILPGPVLPPARFETEVLPTPMARELAHLPITALVYGPDGTEVARHRFGRLPRDHAVALSLDDLVGPDALPAGGHVELVYDFAAGPEADGWLHAIFRYRDRESGHLAETSFGSHMFNMPVVYKSEPQSYAGRPPGLSTRLFLRAGHAGTDAFCTLIYAASQPWRETSETELQLTGSDGAVVARRQVAIPMGGSYHFRIRETFEAADVAAAGDNAYVLIRDGGCRLFGYHGLVSDDGGAFSLDHMFGF